MEDIKFNIGDTVRHKYTKEVLEISEFGTGRGKISIGCVNATKSEWELIKC